MNGQTHDIEQGMKIIPAVGHDCVFYGCTAVHQSGEPVSFQHFDYFVETDPDGVERGRARAARP